MPETMMAGNSALQPLAGAQALAAAPDGHVWLSASAGTGKTHVLTARVYRLLLSGVRPENILCLTFTKAGAAEMAERIHNRLAAWVQIDGPALAADLIALGEDHGPEAQDRARRLFAEVLEATGGGLRIQTIHSFCQQLLSAFPVEAGLIPGFRPLEAREQQVLAREALAAMVVRAEDEKDEALIVALQAMSLRMGEGATEAFLMRCARRHDVMMMLDADVRGWLFAQLDLPTGDVEAEIAAHCSDAAFDMAGLARIAAACAAWGTATGLKDADTIADWRGADAAARGATLDGLVSVFCTAKGELRKFSAKLLSAEPDYAEIAARIAEHCQALAALRLRVGYADMLAQALGAGRAYAQAYAQAKQAVGGVDFDDLIARTVALLNENGMAEWIRFKLDQRTDHILVDEAQDTNIQQWQIVAAVASEFFTVEAEPDVRMRTIFTVGDFKQAIFGFQGTSPAEFELARIAFKRRAEEAAHPFHNLSLDHSFRSTPAVLEVVDATIATVTHGAMGLAQAAGLHISENRFPGAVHLWKPIVAATQGGDDSEGEEDWLADQERTLAQRIATQIKAWIDDGLILASKGRPVHAGDIMILVRRRSDLARLIVARLYEAGVAVAGIDRLRLNAPLGVRDLLAALRFAVQPQDDLNLANLLVSPLIGWTQAQLLERARPRGGALWGHLRDTVHDAPGMEALRAILGQADFTTPYRFLEGLLSGPLDGRRKLIERLGTEARDPIEELLNAALGFENDAQPSLQRFVDWFDRGDVEIVRDAAAQGDSVRLLTVHGAKGLQAPIVILADAAQDPDAGNRMDSLEWVQAEGAKLPIVAPRKAERFGVIGEAAEAAKRADREEHWRLLYVAMTRAEERLLVAGSLPPRAKGVTVEASWHNAVERAMGGLGCDWLEDALWGAARIWRGKAVLAARRTETRETMPVVETAMPGWLREAAPEEARPPRPLAPSAQVEDDVPDPPPSAAMRAGAERGKWLHALFERLPDLPPEERRGAADRWLARIAGVDDAATRRDVIDHALAVIEDPVFAGLFSPDALAEAPIAAVVGEAVISGTVDRLCVGTELVQVVDFKTGRAVPDSVADVPIAHVRQMAAYGAALAVILPGRRVEAALLYTAGPKLIVLPAALLAAHKPGFPKAEDKLGVSAVENSPVVH